MWTRSHTIVTRQATAQQMWQLMTDVNNWHKWDKELEFAKLEGKFEKGNYFTLRPKGGPNVKVVLLETVENKRFLDVTSFPLAKMYDDHVFEETKDGLKITYTVSVKGILSFLWIKLVAGKIAANMTADMATQVAEAAKL